MQGDCLSAILFIFSLTHALNPNELSMKKSTVIQYIVTLKGKKSSWIRTSPEYTDDVTWVSTNKEVIELPHNFAKIQPSSKWRKKD